MRGGLVGGSRVFHCTWPGGRLHGSNSPPQVPEYAERAGNRHKGDEDHIVLMAGALWAYDVEIPPRILARAFSSSRSTKARRRMRSWRVDVQSATARGQTSRGAVPPPTATAWISSSPLSSRYASSIPRDYRLAAMRAPQLPGTVHRKRRRVIQPLNYAPSRRKEPGCPWRTCTGHKRCRSALVLTFPSAAPTTGGKARRRSGIARDSCRRPAGPTRSVRSGSTCTRRRRALLQPKRPRAQARSFSYGNPSDSPGRAVMNQGGTLGRQARGRQAAATHAVTGSSGRGWQA